MQEWGRVRMLMYLLSLMIQIFKVILMTLFANCPPDTRPTTSLEVSYDEPKNYMQTEVA